MKVVYLKTDKFQYDVHSLFKAFYPDDEVMVLIGEKGANAEKEAKITEADEIFDLGYESCCLFMPGSAFWDL